jgi:hypothetical protein
VLKHGASVLLLALFTLLALGCGSSPQELENSPDDFRLIQNGAGGLTITHYVGTRKAVVIPAAISGFPVTVIGEEAFYRNRLTSVIIPNSVTVIEQEAFEGNRLTSVSIPNSVTSIGKYAFKNNQLSSVIILNSHTSIGRDAFSGNPLTKIAITSGWILNTDVGFEANFLDFYSRNNMTAGTYIKRGELWTMGPPDPAIVAEEQRLAEERRLAEEQRLEQQKLAEEQRLEQQKLAEERRLEEERLAEAKRKAEAEAEAARAAAEEARHNPNKLDRSSYRRRKVEDFSFDMVASKLAAGTKVAFTAKFWTKPTGTTYRFEDVDFGITLSSNHNFVRDMPDRCFGSWDSIIFGWQSKSAVNLYVTVKRSGQSGECSVDIIDW